MYGIVTLYQNIQVLTALYKQAECHQYHIMKDVNWTQTYPWNNYKEY